VRTHATRDWLIECLRTGQVVDAACHGQFDDRDFLRSRLRLANGETLTLADALGDQVDIAGLRLLILSACRTAVMDVRGARGEVRSLAAGMLQAGARAVLASQWAVDDQATYLLVAKFAQEWLPAMDTSPAQALARAQAWLRSVTNRELILWRAETGAEERPGQSGNLVGFRGRGHHHTMPEAQNLVRGHALRRTAEGGGSTCPYADPVFWAGFQILGR
jgi:CHAT domain-containing protein